MMKANRSDAALLAWPLACRRRMASPDAEQLRSEAEGGRDLYPRQHLHRGVDPAASIRSGQAREALAVVATASSRWARATRS
jgi:hypothetical protein